MLSFALQVQSTADKYWNNTGMTTGSTTQLLVGYEYDRLYSNDVAPANIQTLATSNVCCTEGDAGARLRARVRVGG